MRLVYEKTGEEVKVGDIVELRDSTKVVVTFFREPHKPSSTGKVSVESPKSITTLGDDRRGSSEYFVGVIGAKWIEREDQEVCPNCDQWATDGDCFNRCKERGFVAGPDA